MSSGKLQEVPASPFPLLRLAIPIRTADGILSAGLYLAAPQNETPFDPNHRALTLLQRNRPCLSLSLNRFTGIDDNQKIHDTPSPLQKANPKAPPIRHLEVRLSDDRQAITFIWKEDDQRFDSAPFPVVNDQRPILGF